MDDIYIDQLVEMGEENSTEANTQFLDPDYFNKYLTTVDGLPLLTDLPLEVYCGQNVRKKTKLGLLPERAYMCHVCNIPFTNSSNLKNHLRIHTGEKPFKCKICGQAFVQSSNLKSHARTHTGERPFVCDVCGKLFSRSSHLSGHKRKHTGEKPYICGTCGDNFATSTHLRNHVKQHSTVTRYMCSICGTSFLHKSQLQFHMKAHTGDQPLKCCDCARVFRSKSDLRSHKKLHAGDKPFVCGKCGKTFKTYAFLLNHAKKCPARIVNTGGGENNDGDESSHSWSAGDHVMVSEESNQTSYLPANMTSQIKIEPNEPSNAIELVDENRQNYTFMGSIFPVDGQFQSLSAIEEPEPAIHLVTMPSDDQRTEQQVQFRILA